MAQYFQELARTLVGSPPNRLALYLLGNVPGFPPMVQTVHLLSIAAVMGSIVLINLRVLGLALPSQGSNELTRRLMPWTWWALPFLAISGLLFIFARPVRYLSNPVVAVKFTLLVPAIILAVFFHRLSTRDENFWERSPWRRVSSKAIAAVSLVLWLGVAMAGRWIAYADYIFPPPQ
jgi:hypothetical protein